MYTKYHDSWEADDTLSAKTFNYIEGQWDEIKSDADIHDHDSRYYTKTSADNTFFSTSFFDGFDAEYLDGYQFNDLVSSILPTGAIMIWRDSTITIPTGWYVCDGSSYLGKTTPDLRDRFIVGAGDTYDVGDTGGTGAWDCTITPTGSITIGDHILTTAELPVHSHTYTSYSNPKTLLDGSGNVHFNAVSATNVIVGEQSVGGGSHGHTGSTITFEAIDSRPQYHSLYYIMKCI